MFFSPEQAAYSPNNMEPGSLLFLSLACCSWSFFLWLIIDGDSDEHINNIISSSRQDWQSENTKSTWNFVFWSFRRTDPLTGGSVGGSARHQTFISHRLNWCIHVFRPRPLHRTQWFQRFKRKCFTCRLESVFIQTERFSDCTTTSTRSWSFGRQQSQETEVDLLTVLFLRRQQDDGGLNDSAF